MVALMRYCLLLVVAALPVAAASQQQQTLEALFSWSGNGRVFQYGIEQQEFLGMIEGVFYTRTAEGELDDAFMECTVKLQLNHATRATRANGNCVIVKSPDDSAFGEYSCEGEFGACHGRFTLTGGTGRFKGVTGGSEIQVRSPLRHLAASLTDAEELVISNGMMHFSALEYRLKGKGGK